MESPPLSPRLMSRFYEVLILLRVLDQVQGEKIAGETPQDGIFQDIKTAEMRRRVLYHLCVICDFQKGGFTVTAIAAENVPCGPRYWMAANGKVDTIKSFLFGVLKILEQRSLSTQPEAQASSFKDELFGKFVAFQQPRVKAYWKLLQPGIKQELERISRTPLPHQGAGYKTWLQGFQSPLQETCDFHKLCALAYSERLSPFNRVEYDPVFEQRVVEERQARRDIRHYIGRLSTLRRATELLTCAADECPEMFQQFELHHLASGASSERPHFRAKLTLDGIAHRIFPENSSESKEFRGLLQRMEETGSVMQRISENYSDKNWQPSVHAELALLEAMHERQCIFYDDDKFIACSKAACFCCYHYICSHPGAFARPACHNKVYRNWKPPKSAFAAADPQNLGQRDIMNNLTAEVRKAVVARVFRQRSRRWHADSSTGITASVMPVSQPQVHPIDTGETDVSRVISGSSGDNTFDHVGSDFDDDEDGGVALP